MIRHVGSKLAAMQDRRPGKVIFIILSDGEQTVDHLRNRNTDDVPYEGQNGKDKLKDLIDEHQNVWKWSFMFMGTNFDSISTGATFGLAQKHCINFSPSDGGINQVMRCVSQNVSSIQKKAKSRIQTYNSTGVEEMEDDDDGFTDLQRDISINPF